MLKAAEHFITRFSEGPESKAIWLFPTLDYGGDFHTDPRRSRPEPDATFQRSGL